MLARTELNNSDSMWCRNICIISWVILAFDWFLLMINWRTDITSLTFFLVSLFYNTDRFRVALHLFSNRLRRRQNVVEYQWQVRFTVSCVAFLFIPHFNVILLWSTTEQTHGNMGSAWKIIHPILLLCLRLVSKKNIVFCLSIFHFGF